MGLVECFREICCRMLVILEKKFSDLRYEEVLFIGFVLGEF